MAAGPYGWLPVDAEHATADFQVRSPAANRRRLPLLFLVVAPPSPAWRRGRGNHYLYDLPGSESTPRVIRLGVNEPKAMCCRATTVSEESRARAPVLRLRIQRGWQLEVT